MELKMNPVTLPKPLTFNYDELKAALEEKVTAYEQAIYAPEQMAAAKADRAALNRLKKALNDERLNQERACMAPFNQFKAQVNELIRIIDAPVAAIDKQVKAFEERKREEKQQQIEAYWAYVLQAEKVPAGICFRQIMDEKWLNASVSMATIKNSIDEKLDKASEDLAVIRALPEYAFEAEQTYISTLDLAKAVNEAHRRSDEAKRRAEWEAEMQRRKAEQEAAIKAKEAEAPAPQTTLNAEMKTPDEPKRVWLSFRANLTLDDAKALKEFFISRGIDFEKI